MVLRHENLHTRVEDSMKIGYIKRTIENKDLKDALQICKTSSEVLTTIAAKMPTTYSICFKNIEIVMRILNLLQTIGMMSRIQINEYDECLLNRFTRSVN